MFFFISMQITLYAIVSYNTHLLRYFTKDMMVKSKLCFKKREMARENKKKKYRVTLFKKKILLNF